eukprot:TRINITY_DN933_c0_g1_i6.p1 TRINITY_DN933_c0_g1~~TRINITY_DN933_c0_g1_i6.p1  ORF type:complete len:703 (-),score=41.83 TRINITY_DN933_c0_g1_i6:914-2719(-)
MSDQQQLDSQDVENIDQNIYADLFHRSQGDYQLVEQWCVELGIPAPPPTHTAPPVHAADPDLLAVSDVAPIFVPEAVPPPSSSMPSSHTPRDLVQSEAPIHPLQDIEQIAIELGAPQSFFCPICMHLMRDPVMLATGQTYERSAIETWLARGRGTCPVTGQMLERPIMVTPNYALRQLIEDWVSQNAPWMLGSDGRLKPAEDLLPPENNGEQNVFIDTAFATSLQQQEMQQALAQQGHNSRETRRRLSQYAYHYVDKRCTEWVFNFLTLVYIVMLVVAFGFNEWEIEPLSRNPLVGVSSSTVLQIGGLDYDKIYEEQQYWRLLTSIWITVGLIHIVGTIGVMWLCVQHLGIVMQWNSILLIYLFSAFAGAVGSTLMAQGSVLSCGTVGVAGLMGALVAEHLVDWRLYKNHLWTFALIILLLGSIVFVSLAPMLDNWGNLSAFIAGFLLTVAVLFANRQRVRRFPKLKILLAIVCFVSLVGFILVGILALLFGASPSKDCEWCSILTCPADVSWWQCEAAAANPRDCVFTFGVSGENTTQLTCPSGYSGVVNIESQDDRLLSQLCQELCSLVRDNLIIGGDTQPGNDNYANDGLSQEDVQYI